MINLAHITNHRFGEKNKVLQLQAMADANDNASVSDTGWSNAFSAWCMIAVPLRPASDAAGTITGACEAIVTDIGDQRTIIGTRDFRVSKYAQDLKPGEAAFLNGFGTRLFLGEKTVALNAGGGFLSFDVEGKKVALAGIPSKPGAGSPYLTISSDTIGLVSATGAASIALKSSTVTLNGASVAIDAGRINLGKNASDPIITYSQLMTILTTLQVWMNAVATATGVAAPPLPIQLRPGKRVLAPYGG